MCREDEDVQRGQRCTERMKKCRGECWRVGKESARMGKDRVRVPDRERARKSMERKYKST